MRFTRRVRSSVFGLLLLPYFVAALLVVWVTPSTTKYEHRVLEYCIGRFCWIAINKQGNSQGFVSEKMVVNDGGIALSIFTTILIFISLLLYLVGFSRIHEPSVQV